MRPGFTDIRYTIKVESDAPASLIEEIVRAAERTSPMLDNITHGVPVSSHVELPVTS